VSELPIFTFHAVGDWLRSDLDRLARAGYQTLGAEQIARYARGEWTPGERAIALTFDDGDRSLEDVAAPLLAEHGMRAIAFVVAGLVPDESNHRLVGWRSLAHWVGQGVLEVGSHSEYHHHVPIRPRIIGYVTPETDADFTANIPVPRVSGSRPVRLGEPIFAGRPRYTAPRAFRPDEAGIERSVHLVESAGPSFFQRTHWQEELRKLIGSVGEYESTPETESAIRSDMKGASRRIAEKCPNRAASHLCYPWYARNDRADRLAREAGIEVMYGGIAARLRQSSAVLRRLPPDFLWCLPGPGRISLTELVRRRVRARRSAARASDDVGD
jgi:peptidoglycan/xylan/chitin deacetylase (PgdA/CDA1 family)